MRYENRQPPEGINTSREHPLRQFAQLSLAAIVLVVLLVVLLQSAGSVLARYVPFSFERAVMNQLDLPLGDARRHPEMTAYLNTLAQRLSDHMPLPEGMTVTVHYDDADVFNAFATMGGHLLFYRGLLARMPDENTLSMVMAHEIAHVLHRDPVAALGGGVASTLAVLGLAGQAGSGLAGEVLTQSGMLTSVQFTRRMEVSADQQALAALNAYYGHINGASHLFQMFRDARGDTSGQRVPAWLERFLSTHPRDEDRIGSIAVRAAEQQWETRGALTPLPEDFRRWL